jgi:hypothetical protein
MNYYICHICQNFPFFINNQIIWQWWRINIDINLCCTRIYVSFFFFQIPLPSSPPWFAIFNVDENNIQEICLTILKLYARPRVSTFYFVWHIGAIFIVHCIILEELHIHLGMHHLHCLWIFMEFFFFPAKSWKIGG